MTRRRSRRHRPTPPRSTRPPRYRQPHHQHHLDGRGEREREAQALPKAPILLDAGSDPPPVRGASSRPYRRTASRRGPPEQRTAPRWSRGSERLGQDASGRARRERGCSVLEHPREPVEVEDRDEPDHRDRGDQRQKRGMSERPRVVVPWAARSRTAAPRTGAACRYVGVGRERPRRLGRSVSGTVATVRIGLPHSRDGRLPTRCRVVPAPGAPCCPARCDSTDHGAHRVGPAVLRDVRLRDHLGRDVLRIRRVHRDRGSR